MNSRYLIDIQPWKGNHLGLPYIQLQVNFFSLKALSLRHVEHASQHLQKHKLMVVNDVMGTLAYLALNSDNSS